MTGEAHAEVQLQQGRVRMPSFVPRSLEPYQKRELFEKRVRELRGAVKAGVSASRVASAAEKVRLAALAVVKAKRALVRGTDRVQQISNLQQEEDRWLALTAEEIVAQLARKDR
jgi:hypothetical protein